MSDTTESLSRKVAKGQQRVLLITPFRDRLDCSPVTRGDEVIGTWCNASKPPMQGRRSSLRTLAHDHETTAGRCSTADLHPISKWPIVPVVIRQSECDRTSRRQCNSTKLFDGRESNLANSLFAETHLVGNVLQTLTTWLTIQPEPGGDHKSFSF